MQKYFSENSLKYFLAHLRSTKMYFHFVFLCLKNSIWIKICTFLFLLFIFKIMYKYLLFFSFSLLLCSFFTKKNTTSTTLFPPEGCKKLPPFVEKLGFDLAKSAFSTSEKMRTGIVFTDLGSGKIYQHQSWTKAGHLGPIIITERGDIFSAPIPVINLIDNKPDDQNKIYKIDSQSGEMNFFMELPKAAKPSAENPFGTLGMAYDCDTKVLYVSTVFGSTLHDERGRIYAINTENGKIIDSLINVDAMGLGVSFENAERTFFYGTTRLSTVYAVKLDATGKFINKPKMCCSLEGLGPRGDDRARKIRFTPKGEMIIQAVEFYYNLIAPTEKQETIYYYKYDVEKKNWTFAGYGG